MSLKRHYLFFFAVLSAITLVTFFYLGRPITGIDDGNIFLNYAKHVARGEGFVFNTGDEKVEGFTSMLWVLICALFYTVFSSPEWPLMIAMLCLTTLTVTLVYQEWREQLTETNPEFARKYALLSFVFFLCVIGPSYVTWSVLSLMENGLWNFLFLLVVVLLLRFYRRGSLTLSSKIALVVCSILLLLTRPESLAWNAVFIAVLGFVEWVWKKKLWFTTITVVAIGGAVAALTLFRKSYFGYPLPNTYYAKVSHNKLYNLKQGLEYFLGFTTGFNVLITFLLAILLVGYVWYVRQFLKRSGLLLQRLKSLPSFVIVIKLILIGLILPLITGGDHFGSFRFYQNILLLFIWGLPALFWLLNAERQQKNGLFLNPLLATLFLFFAFTSFGSLLYLKRLPKNQLDYEFFLAKDGRQTAQQLNQLWPVNKPTIGIITVGGFGLAYEGHTVDLMGLNNTLMGHSKGERIGIKNHAAFNKDVFYQLHPDLLLPKQVSNMEEAKLKYAEMLGPFNFDNIAMKNIFSDSVFKQHYRPMLLTKNGAPSFFMFVNTGYYPLLKADNSFGITPVIF